jgi:hypothetical protein
MSSGPCDPASYLDLGWPIEEVDGLAELITGTVVDALEVPSTAGLLAASWWRFSKGYPDEIRGLPALPDPRKALALIAAGDRHFFLARAGECPWRTQDPVTTAAAATPRAAVIRWHSQGSRIPLPASGTDPDASELGAATGAVHPDLGATAPGYEPAAPYWVHWPRQGIKLTSPAVLLHLLATAAAATRLGPNMLTLDHDVLAIPVFGEPPTTPVRPRVPSPAAFGFGRRHG